MQTDKTAQDELAAARDKAAGTLTTWRMHQANCPSCSELPDDDKCGPGCGDGFRIWCRWANASDHASWLGQLLDPPAPPEPEKTVHGHLTMF